MILIIFQILSEIKLMRARNIIGSVFVLSQIFPCFSPIVIDRNLVIFFQNGVNNLAFQVVFIINIIIVYDLPAKCTFIALVNKIFGDLLLRVI